VQGEWVGTFNITNVDGTIIPVATQICFDSYFPEIFRLQSIQGAQVTHAARYCTHTHVSIQHLMTPVFGTALTTLRN
jgi:hypothetical protein